MPISMFTSPSNTDAYKWLLSKIRHAIQNSTLFHLSLLLVPQLFSRCMMYQDTICTKTTCSYVPPPRSSPFRRYPPSICPVHIEVLSLTVNSERKQLINNETGQAIHQHEAIFTVNVNQSVTTNVMLVNQIQPFCHLWYRFPLKMLKLFKADTGGSPPGLYGRVYKLFREP